MKKQLLMALIMVPLFNFAQVTLVKDINPGVYQGIRLEGVRGDAEIIAFQNQILFQGTIGREGSVGSGRELHVSDGTLNGTNLLKDLRPGSLSSTPKNFFYRSLTDEIYFSASPGSIRKLFKTDGTNAGTVMVTTLFNDPRRFIEYDNRVFFNSGNNNVAMGTEFSFTNGSLLHGSYDLNQYAPSGNSQSSDPGNYTVYNGSLYFSANFNNSNSTTTAKGRELGISDGTFLTTGLFRDINLGANGSDPNHFTVFNNKLYFTADNGTNGREIWVTDGFILGTGLLQDLNPGSNGSNPQNLTVVGNRLYFSADNGTNGNELYYMTTSENIVLYKDINSGAGSSSPTKFINRGNTLFFSADNGINGRELWSADGTVFGVNMVKDINPGAGNSDPAYFELYNNKLYFSANNGTNGIELFVSNGNAQSTTMLEDINPGPASGDPRALTVSNNILFFHADNGSIGRELWKYLDPALSVTQNDIEKFQLYPNPTKNSFNIAHNGLIDSVEIYDINGKKILQFDEEIPSYNIEKLDAGMYFVKINSASTTQTIKLIKK